MLNASVPVIPKIHQVAMGKSDGCRVNIPNLGIGGLPQIDHVKICKNLSFMVKSSSAKDPALEEQVVVRRSGT